MKKKILLFSAALFLAASSAFAQTVTYEEHYVTKRPVMPTVTRVASPGAGYVWIDEDWKYDGATNQYQWTGGHWVAPENGKKYYKGKWKKDKKGYAWESGYWK
jgi:hypothetical protein